MVFENFGTQLEIKNPIWREIRIRIFNRINCDGKTFLKWFFKLIVDFGEVTFIVL